jgi:CheY-like chemotaxis protein
MVSPCRSPINTLDDLLNALRTAQAGDVIHISGKTVIVISSTLTERLRQQFESRGVTAIFEKPFAPDALARVLKQAARSTDI